ncbi:hypothetical protein Sjap_018857 [Stephania japonica]|uniref:Fibronectin type III-like domain-containing protein n=1 Tax=Stephania japonica TaxID=461633 RepID=A0AAP0NJX9_9MAGN
MRLGLFDGNPAKGKFGMLGPQNVCSEEHKELALEAARQSIVLLKNEQSILPLSIDGITRIKSIGVIGPIANNSAELLGDYSGYPCEMKSIVDGLKAFVPNTIYAPGCFDVQCYSFDGFAEAVRIASTVDVVVVIAGLDLSQETEGRDRMSLLLPGNQMKLISAIADASKRPLVLVLTGGGPLDILSAKQDPLIASILWVGYPGEAGGQALAEVLFGVVNPSGRLPMTWYPESFANVPMNDMRMRSDMAHGYPGRTYRFYTGERAYNFGEGLSYTSYTSNFISIPTRICLSASSIRTYSRKGFDYVVVDEIPSQTCDLMKFDANICVNNTGNMAGSHAVLLFCEPPKIFESVPLKQLIGFTKVHVEANSATETSITVDPCKHLSVVDEEGTRVLPLAWTGLKLEQELLLLPIKKC